MLGIVASPSPYIAHSLTERGNLGQYLTKRPLLIGMQLRILRVRVLV